LSADIESTEARPSGSTVQTQTEPITLHRRSRDPPMSSEAQENPPDLTTENPVISHARLSPRERQVVADISNRFVSDSLAASDLARQGTLSDPPTYME
jgi:hypothetical protein